MRILYFTHSIRSCWNNGHVHFLRGVLRELRARGHDAQACEIGENWSANNLVANQGYAALQRFEQEWPELAPIVYSEADLSATVEGADIVIVHEWNNPELVSALGTLRRRGERFVLLFHDTHHRGVSDPASLARYDLTDFDGVLAFGAVLAEIYRLNGWGRRVYVWHEAADTRIFRPHRPEAVQSGLVWIGNWGDNERTNELRSFLLEPACNESVALDVYGVRYPQDALAMLTAYKANYCGWIANSDVPLCFSRYQATVHVPRRYYAQSLPGIPTIRIFEALACGIPLICAPWEDSENLFRPGRDYLLAHSAEEMCQHLRAVTNDPGLRNSLISHGLETVRSRHSCTKRVEELLSILEEIRAPVSVP